MRPTTKTRVLGTTLCAAAFLALALARGAWQGEARAVDDKAPPPATAVEFAVAPYLQSATKTAITVMAETTTPLICTVRYGLTAALKGTATGKPGTMHELRLEA